MPITCCPMRDAPSTVTFCASKLAKWASCMRPSVLRVRWHPSATSCCMGSRTFCQNLSAPPSAKPLRSESVQDKSKRITKQKKLNTGERNLGLLDAYQVQQRVPQIRRSRQASAPFEPLHTTNIEVEALLNVFFGKTSHECMSTKGM